MTSNIVKLDGEINGVIVKVADSNKYIIGKDKMPRLFNNLAVAKVIARSIIPDTRFEYFFKLGDIVVSLDDCQQLRDKTWSYFKNGHHMKIKEYHMNKTMNLGYICFEDGDTERCDKDYGYTRQHELMNYIGDVLVNILYCKGDKYAITSIKRIHKEFIVSIKGTTSKIHILYNSKLMDFNQSRKAIDAKCLPFRKEMDKYLTFYLYATKDCSESLRLEAEDKVSTIIEYIMEDLDYNHEDICPKYISVNSGNRYIEIEED
jgi:hypothetical protein